MQTKLTVEQRLEYALNAVLSLRSAIAQFDARDSARKGSSRWRDRHSIATEHMECAAHFEDMARESPVVAEGRMPEGLRKFIEGMAVSVDVSTGEHDIDRRYYGKVDIVQDERTGKHGVILLVQQPEPNFTRADPEALTGALLRCTIDCPHTITEDRIVFERDPKADGHNALNQLSRRLAAVVKEKNLG